MGAAGAAGLLPACRSRSHVCLPPQLCCMTVPWDTRTAAAARPPSPSTTVYGAWGCTHAARPGRPVGGPGPWPPSALRPLSSRCVEMLVTFLAAALEDGCGALCPGPRGGRWGLPPGCQGSVLLELRSPCLGPGGATDWAHTWRHPGHHQGLRPGPTRAGHTGHSHGGWSALCGGHSGVPGLQQVGLPEQGPRRLPAQGPCLHSSAPLSPFLGSDHNA